MRGQSLRQTSARVPVLAAMGAGLLLLWALALAPAASRGADTDADDPALVAVPDVIGLTGAAAIAAVREARLEPALEIEDDITVLEMMEGFADLGGGTLAPGEVYITHPGAGELVEVGSTVTLKLPAEIVIVPDVVALPEDVAATALEAAGLVSLPMVADDAELEAVAASYIDRPLPVAGSVLRTSPAGGDRATVGTSVITWLSPALVKVPDVNGLTQAEASAAIEAVGLVPIPVMFDAGDIYGWDAYTAADGSLPPVGEVMGSLPIAGWPLAIGAGVELELMPSIVEVPNVLHLTEPDAVAAVQAAGLVPDASVLEAEPIFGFPYSLLEEPVPVVVAITDPAPGELVVEGSTVTLGLPPDLVRVPDVIDRKPQKAAASIEQAGLAPEVVVERGEDFIDAVNALESKPLAITVLGTSPDAGHLAERGSTVVLHVPPRLAKVPDALGLEPKKALARIEKAGFVPETVVLEADPLLGISYSLLEEPVPVVVAMTDPAPGELAERGSTVALGIPPDLVDVPMVLDLDFASAAARVEGVGLVPAPREMTVEELSGALLFSLAKELPDPDLVFHSDPFAGTLVERASVVELAFPPVLTEVPFVTDMAEADAIAAVNAAGLVPAPVVMEDHPLLDRIEVSWPPVVWATEPDGGATVAAGSTIELYLPPEPRLDAAATGANARLVHTLFNLAPDEQGSTELACTYTGSATFETDYDWWSIIYRGPYWHDVDGNGVFVCSEEVGEQTIVRGTFANDPLELTLDDYSECELDEFSFDGTTISGVTHQDCVYPSFVFTYEVLVDLGE